MSLVGKTIKFINQYDETLEGKVIDKIVTNQGELFMPGTAYLVECKLGEKLEVVPYFRIHSIIRSNERIIPKVPAEDRVNLNAKDLPGIIPKTSWPKDHQYNQSDL